MKYRHLGGDTHGSIRIDTGNNFTEEKGIKIPESELCIVLTILGRNMLKSLAKISSFWAKLFRSSQPGY